jgi:histidinol-phosphate aminotransferase
MAFGGAMSWRALLQDGLPPRARLRHPGNELARLDLNEAPFPPDPDELSALMRALLDVDLNRYPDDGAPALRAALAAQWHVSPDEILMGNGSIEIVATLMTAFRRPGARLLLPAPTFDQFGSLARLHGYELVHVPLDDRFQVDEPRTLAAIDRHRPTLAFFASPNNPTGSCLSPAALQRLARRMEAVFVVDEAYADFAGQSLLPRAPVEPGLFVMRSLSKVGLAGVRLGALVGARAAIAEIDRARLPFNVSALAQAAGCAALAFPTRTAARVSAIVRLRRTLASALAQLPGLRVYPSDANFLLVRTPGDAAELCRQLLARGVAVRDVSGSPALAGCLRITVGTAQDNRRCVEALAAVLARLPGAGVRSAQRRV